MGKASRRKRERAPLLREPGLCAHYAGHACNPGCTCSSHPCRFEQRVPVSGPRPRYHWREGQAVIECDRCAFKLFYDGHTDSDLMDPAGVLRYHRETAHQRPVVNRLAA